MEPELLKRGPWGALGCLTPRAPNTHLAEQLPPGAQKKELYPELQLLGVTGAPPPSSPCSSALSLPSLRHCHCLIFWMCALQDPPFLSLVPPVNWGPPWRVGAQSSSSCFLRPAQSGHTGGISCVCGVNSALYLSPLIFLSSHHLSYLFFEHILSVNALNK